MWEPHRVEINMLKFFKEREGKGRDVKRVERVEGGVEGRCWKV